MKCPKCTDKFVLDNDSGYQVNNDLILNDLKNNCKKACIK